MHNMNGRRIAKPGRCARRLLGVLGDCSSCCASSCPTQVRTDEVDGFLLDRGFQIFLTSYPEAQASAPCRPRSTPLAALASPHGGRSRDPHDSLL